MKKILALPAELYQNRKLVLSLAKNDFKTKYAGSYLGIVWALVPPFNASWKKNHGTIPDTR